jgi:cell division ATPase FtsA
MGLLFTSKKEKIIAIFDIGSGSVGGALVRIPTDKSKIPTIIQSVRTEIKFREDLDFNIFIKDMISALSTTATSLYEKKISAPMEIHCVLSSPWYLSETRKIRMSNNKSFIFTNHLADELIKKEIDSLNILYKNKYEDLNSLPKIIEQQIMGVSLNGYTVDDPLGKRCKSFEIEIAISLSPTMCIDLISRSIKNIYHIKNIKFCSFSLSTYLVLRDKYITTDSYLLVDVSGEITDVGIVTKGILRSVISFPFGRRTFFQSICTKLKIELRDAKELFKLYNSGNLSNEFKDKVIPILKSIEAEWGDEFRKCVGNLPRTLILPSAIFLTADSDVKDWFAEVLRSEKYIESTLSGHKCSVLKLEGPEFLNMCDIKDGNCDEFLMIESIAIMKKMGK